MSNGYGALIDQIEAPGKEKARRHERERFAARCVAVRHAIGLTQLQMADLLQVARSTYCAYEQAGSTPAGTSAKEIDAFLTRMEKHHDLRQP